MLLTVPDFILYANNAKLLMTCSLILKYMNFCLLLSLIKIGVAKMMLQLNVVFFFFLLTYLNIKCVFLSSQ